MHECQKCSAYGLRFQRAYEPSEAAEGNREARVWIIGLNPAVDPDWVDPRTAAHLQQYFDDPSSVHSYFRDFASVSRMLFEQFGKLGGTAHTDLVKCSNKKWPPPGVTRKGIDAIVKNCSPFLAEQIHRYKPAMLVCNGAEVSAFVKKLFPVPTLATHELVTSYFANVEGHRICLVLAGFIGRIDNYAKRRLGYEIEARLQEMGLAT